MKIMWRRYSCTLRLVMFLLGFLVLFVGQLSLNLQRSFPPQTSSSRIVNQTDFHSIFQSRWNYRLFRLARQFAHINLDLLLSVQTRSNRTITYYCAKNCGGWGDRLRGITSTYILALCLRRRFLIDMPSPYELSHFLRPNFIDWKVKQRPVNPLEVNSMNGRNARELDANISSGNLTEIWSNYEHLRLTTNSDYITPILKNRFFRSIISQIGIRSNESSQQDLFPLIFELLFKPTSLISNELNNLLQHTFNRPILCMHIRLGQNPTIPKDAKIPYRQFLVSHMIEFIDRNLSHSQSSIFVTSDSNDSLETLRRHYGRERILTINGPIIHIDRPNRKNDSIDLIIQGFFKVIADFYFLGECDLLLMPRSGFSHWANLRRINPYTNLYFYCRGLHRMTHPNWRRPHVLC